MRNAAGRAPLSRFPRTAFGEPQQQREGFHGHRDDSDEMAVTSEGSKSHLRLRLQNCEYRNTFSEVSVSETDTVAL